MRWALTHFATRKLAAYCDGSSRDHRHWPLPCLALECVINTYAWSTLWCPPAALPNRRTLCNNEMMPCKSELNAPLGNIKVAALITTLCRNSKPVNYPALRETNRYAASKRMLANSLSEDANGRQRLGNRIKSWPPQKGPCVHLGRNPVKRTIGTGRQYLQTNAKNHRKAILYQHAF